MEIDYSQIDFSLLNRYDMQNVTAYFAIDPSLAFSYHDLVRLLIETRPVEVPTEVGAVIRAHYIKNALLQPFKFTFDYILNRDASLYDKVFQLDSNRSDYHYALLKTIYYAGMLSDEDEIWINHEQFKRVMLMTTDDMNKWLQFFRIPYQRYTYSQKIKESLRLNFNPFRINQYLVDREIECNINNMLGFEQFKHYIYEHNDNGRVMFYDGDDIRDLDKTHLVIVRQYQPGVIVYWLSPIPASEYTPTSIDKVLYIGEDDDREMLRANTFYQTGITISTQQIMNINSQTTADYSNPNEPRIVRGKMSMIHNNIMYDIRLITMKDLLLNSFSLFPMQPPSRNVLYLEKLQSYHDFSAVINDVPPLYESGQVLFTKIREVALSPDGLILDHNDAPISNGYPEKYTLYHFQNDGGLHVFWVSPYYSNVIFAQPLVYDERLNSLVLANILYYPMTPELSQSLNDQPFGIVLGQGNMLNFYTMTNQEFIEGNFPISLPEPQEGRIKYVDNINNINV